MVASEVRSLAQRSASAAKEIKELITDSVRQVDSGSRLADTAGAAMQEIVGSVRHVAELMTQIATASQEQSQDIGQVGQSVSRMDQSAQQNAVLVQQAAVSAQSLQEQTARLEQIVGIFKLDAVPRDALMPLDQALTLE